MYTVQIFVYDDKEDHGTVLRVNETDIKAFETQNLMWNREYYNLTENEVYVTMAGTNAVSFGADGIINLKVKLK